ncbi:MAG TPA: Zn-ribbon domain-containing OB-fold protein [Candidatus Thermoplasmatota archaeon]|nr:Zn-ribbon domain-containing OB-fold protein [Candidatus Thermoplasmatota archaeon]
MSVPRFWREIPQRYNLQASRCDVCHAIHFPPREVCPTCRRASIGHMKAVKLAGRGTILEWTRVHKAARGYELQAPYFLALVQTEEGPVITGQVVDSLEVATGDRVQAVFRRLGQDGEAGVIYYGTKWQVVPGGHTPSASPAPAKKGKAKGGRKGRKGRQTVHSP